MSIFEHLPFRILSKFLLPLLLFMVSLPSAFAEKPKTVTITVRTGNQVPDEPVLRLDAGVHTGRILDIDISADGRYIVTAGEDKTARIWDSRSGSLLKVLRPPLGEGKEGMLYSAAFSPDGNTIAVSGWCSYDQYRKHRVYLFNRADGRMIRHVGSFPEVVTRLAFSPDGAHLAVLLLRKGVRLLRTSNWKLVAKDKEYDGDAYGMAFSSSGMLATTCKDGCIRLYDTSLRLVSKADMPPGSEPNHLSFSPDGEKLAVGYVKLPLRVDILSGRNLEPIARLKASIGGKPWNSRHGILLSTAWSQDGSELYAAGGYLFSGSRHLARWSLPRAEMPDKHNLKCSGSILDLEAIPGGGLVYCDSSGNWGLLGRDMNLAHLNRSNSLDYRSYPERLLISPDAMHVAFYCREQRFHGHFSLLEPAMQSGRPVNLLPPLTKAPGLDIQGWDDFRARPMLNGSELKQFAGNDSPMSMAIAPDHQSFIIGGQLFLYRFDSNGKLLWQHQSPASANKVNISADSKILVVAYRDGVIRWHDMQNGDVLLSLFPHQDRKRWVTWTASGYYHAALGAEDLIGWHLNQGSDQAADFFPASRFRDSMYRPDVVRRVLVTRDEDMALRLADQERGRKNKETAIKEKLPPVVEILSPANGASFSSQEVKLTYSLRTPGGEPVTELKVLVDGRPVERRRGLRVQAEERVRSVLALNLPRRDAEVSLIAVNSNSASTPATVRLKWTGQKEYTRKPKLYLLAIGVGDYGDERLDLGFPAKDASDMARVMSAQKGRLYRDVKVRLLTDEQATRNNVLKGLNLILKETTSKDVAMVFLAGHGVNDSWGDFYYLPHGLDTEDLMSTAVPFSVIKKTVENLAGKALFFVDTCHSGNVLGTRRSLDMNLVVNELISAENGAVVFTSSTGNQYSVESERWGNGAFTKALVEGLSGRADFGDTGRITVNMLDYYVSDRVKELTGGKQTPTSAKPATVPDFPVALSK